MIAVIVGASLGVSYYQLYYIPEYNAKPIIPAKVLNPSDSVTIIIVPGSENPSQTQNFTPKTQTAQLGVNNLVIWKNTSEAAHTVTPDTPFKDGYNGDFGSPGVIKPGATYQFVFTQVAVIPYHCEPHPWMKGTITIVPGALTS